MRHPVFAATLFVSAIAMSSPVSLTWAAPSAPSSPTGPSADQIALRVQAVYDQTKTFKADFKQDYYIKAHDQHRSSEGKVAFEKPGKMSWRYDQPNGNRVVSDGRLLKVYEPANQQMFEQPVDKSQQAAALAFLMGEGELTKSFTLRTLDPSTEVRRRVGARRHTQRSDAGLPESAPLRRQRDVPGPTRAGHRCPRKSQPLRFQQPSREHPHAARRIHVYASERDSDRQALRKARTGLEQA